MPRRVWIIAKKDKLEDSDKADASLNGCPEIANGIPPILGGVISENQLPIVYEEPESPETEPPHSSHVSIINAIDTAKARPVKVKRVWQGKDYFYDCLVAESVKDQYVAGNITIGDYVIVHFDDIGEQVVTAKIFKSW